MSGGCGLDFLGTNLVLATRALPMHALVVLPLLAMSMCGQQDIGTRLGMTLLLLSVNFMPIFFINKRSHVLTFIHGSVLFLVTLYIFIVICIHVSAFHLYVCTFQLRRRTALPTELHPSNVFSSAAGGVDISKGVQLFREKAKQLTDKHVPPSSSTTNITIEG